MTSDQGSLSREEEARARELRAARARQQAVAGEETPVVPTGEGPSEPYPGASIVDAVYRATPDDVLRDVPGAVGEASSRLTDALGAGAGRLMDAVSGAPGAITDAARFVGGAGKDAIDSVVEFGANVAGSADDVANLAAAAVTQGTDALAPLGGLASHVGDAAGVVAGAAADALSAAPSAGDVVGAAIDAAGNLGAVVEAVVPVIQAGAEAAIPILEAGAEAAVPALEVAVEVVGGILGSVSN